MLINIISAGAAQSVVTALGKTFSAQTGCSISATFGAVGTMHEKLINGAPCDLILLSKTLIDKLAADGHVLRKSIGALGTVRTGVAIRSGDAVPDISSAGFGSTIANATALYFPNPQQATAGIHFMRVLESLGLAQASQGKLRTFPNGATAMRTLAQEGAPGSIGVTQITEIRHTAGVELLGPLPKEHELATVYALAVTSRAAEGELAGRFARMITDAASRKLRTAAGFELA